MKGVALSAGQIAAMRRAADDAYPEECCGFLFAAADGGDAPVRRIVEVVPAPNRSSRERNRRFVILPEELRDAERHADRVGAVVGGFYHSHPDHPARPSVFDQEHAWPWYAYLILASGSGGRLSPPGAFELDPERREFREIALSIGTPEGGAPAP